MKVLYVKSGPLEGNAYGIGPRTLIGRSPECDIQVIDREASRKHAAVLELDDGSVLVRDLASQNGTYLSDEPIKEALLSPGDQLAIGASIFEFREVDDQLAASEDIDIKLLTGSAREVTVAARISPEAQAKLEAMFGKNRPSSPAGPASGPCCGSPLAERARAEGWPHCPSCGAKVSSPDT